jgi:hypothetical protein
VKGYQLPKADLLEAPNRVRVNIGGVLYWREPERIAERASQKIGPMRIFMGEVLRDERLSQGKRLRDIDGIALGYVSEVERGIKEPSSEVLEMYCKNLGIDVVDALRRTADKIEAARN